MSSRQTHFPTVTLRSTLWILLALCLSPSLRPAHAYVDPGTGSYIIQVSIGVIFGALYAFKRFISIAWQKVKSYTSKTKTEE